jgi:hypothetical protein
MKVPKGPTIRDLMNEIPRLRPEHKATQREREKARESLRKRCGYLFAPNKKKS